MVTKFCEEVVAQGDTEGVLPCLVEHKNDQGMDEKCHAAIEHWQLVSRVQPQYNQPPCNKVPSRGCFPGDESYRKCMEQNLDIINHGMLKSLKKGTQCRSKFAGV